MNSSANGKLNSTEKIFSMNWYRVRVNSSTNGRLNSTGKMLSINHVEFSFPLNFVESLLIIHLDYSGILFYIEFVEFFHCIVDELIEFTFSIKSVEFSFPQNPWKPIFQWNLGFQ